ncbi:nucleoside triphosphate pyrophosphohydrolase/pyrophosphatase MazG [Clostridium tepidiprofundi DSM 19306]|uniref:Nucleoside triphosphate pyrophosphohydrolase/pyrophosphatase MazG n=1 Tax=Clostridium tepidiprofundi DSM 19306 TaxID=1121338 RepID=A0A151B374_9CLOT|nr:nucleoside triphosphate pyrophosphohydrolase [Clostridium tepidiprofundi]KYH34368.1 nucleoside triphosphate pyrophosphohydrolase/pyrophosphatase MazG [Clostridium tepidiprofundi DSM 19306]
MIKIIGLGPGSEEALTLGAIKMLKNEKRVYLRTRIHPTVEYIDSIGINYETYDDKYESYENFDEVYNSIAEDLIEKHEKFKDEDIVYAVPGHPLVAEKSVTILIELAKKRGIDTKIVPAVSFVDALMESLNIDPIEGIKIIDAFDINNQILDKRTGIVITQVYNKFIAAEVKLAISEYYGDDFEIYFVRAAGIEGMESIRKIRIFELDRQCDIDHLTSIYIPKDLNVTKDFNDLIEIIDILRGENGCPWDREQNHETIKRCLIEECYEVLEAIDEKNEEKLIEELGDVLLQVVFHAKIGKDEGYFNISDVIKAICDKMIYRHPHVFGKANVEDSNQVLINWDELKKKEKGYENYTDELKHIPKNFPALMRATKVQSKASKVGFDWESVESAFEKVVEEYHEVKDVYKSNNRAKILEEVGDLIFACVNVARFLNVDPEEALSSSVNKFINRFEFIESTASRRGLKLNEMSLEQMDELWDEAKKNNIN